MWIELVEVVKDQYYMNLCFSWMILLVFSNVLKIGLTGPSNWTTNR